jgi:hypothetical protein
VAIPKKIRNFINENKDASREEIVQGLVDTFKIKETTAITYYSNKNFHKKNAQKLVFDYLKANPKIVDDIEVKKHAKKIGVCDITYKKYRSLYEVGKCDIESNSCEVRKREKFHIDDSRL